MQTGEAPQPIKLLVADDEFIIREGIRSHINWTELGIRLMGAAENGKEALDMLADEPADILLTDVHMPVMDGIELCREARKRYPNLKIIILSGFEEFEFAKQALEVSAMRYLLKPFTRKELEEVLLDASRDIRHYRRLESNLEVTMVRLQESLPLLCENVLNRLVEGRLHPEEVRAKLELLDISLKGSRFVVLVAEKDHNDGRGAGQPGANEELMTVLMKDEFGMALKERGQGVVFSGLNANAVCILEVGPDDLYEQVLDFAEAVKARIQTALKLTVSIGVGAIRPGYAGIAVSYREAQESLAYRFLIGQDSVIPIDRINLSDSAAFFAIPEEYGERLAMAVRYGNNRGIRGELDSLFDYMRGGTGGKISELRLAVKDFLAMTLRQLGLSGNRLKDLYGTDFDPYTAIDRYKTMDDMYRGLCTMIQELSGYIHDKRGNKLRNVIQRAVDYIQSHYHLEELSINTLSEELSMNASYFSRLFKQETGATFTEYLTKTRLERAKELLKGTTKRISEITYEVGMKDPYYFSTLFKKYTGINPTEFREQ